MLRRCVSLVALLAIRRAIGWSPVQRGPGHGNYAQLFGWCGGAVDKRRLRTHSIIDAPCVGQNMVHVANAVTDEDQRQRLFGSTFVHFVENMLFKTIRERKSTSASTHHILAAMPQFISTDTHGSLDRISSQHSGEKETSMELE